MRENPMNKKPTVFTVKVISLGRVTIPENIRILHDIQDGDMVELDLLSVQKISGKESEKHE